MNLASHTHAQSATLLREQLPNKEANAMISLLRRLVHAIRETNRRANTMGYGWELLSRPPDNYS